MTLPDASAVARVGTTQAEPESIGLRAGPLSAEFAGGGLRYVRYGKQEVIRAISFLARDENWGTHSLKLADVDISETFNSFQLRFKGTCGPTGSELRIAALIDGHADGRLSFTVDAKLDGDLLTNRTGFVVLHPIEVSGRPVVVETVDGKRQSTRFPEQIDPLQPFRDIRALTTRHSESITAEVRMEGDTFEMEDQRNWSDASFKTYVRPLALPWPYTLAKGESFTQAVSVSVHAAAAVAAGDSAGDVKLTRVTRADTRAHALAAIPELGIGVRAEHLTSALQKADALRALSPAYFNAHLDMRHDDPDHAVSGFARLSDASGVPYVLEVVVTADGNPAEELNRVAAAVGSRKGPIALQVSPAPDLKAVLPGSPWPPCPSFDEIFSAARDAFPGLPLGGGSFAYFTELNRKRPPADQLDYITFTTCPIVHAADDRSVMETLTTLPFIAASARALFSPVPYRVGPSTIAARDNPYGAASLPNREGALGERICLTDNDPRQRALYGAAWNLGYFAQFAVGGATHIALSELTGPRGMFDGAKPTPWFHLFAALASWKGAAVSALSITQGDAPIVAFAVQRDGQAALWLANLFVDPQDVELDLPTHGASIARWNERADFAAPPVHEALVAGPVRLGAYETVEIRHAT
jgi:D-apionolactonase